MAPTNLFKYLFGAGASGQVIAVFLFLRMAMELNRVLPPERRMPLIEIRMHFFEIKRLHEEAFPASRLRAAWFGFTVTSILVMVLAVLLELRLES